MEIVAVLFLFQRSEMKDSCVINLIENTSDPHILPAGTFLWHWILCKNYSFYYCIAKQSSFYKLHTSCAYILLGCLNIFFTHTRKNKRLEIIPLINMAVKHTVSKSQCTFALCLNLYHQRLINLGHLLPGR